MDEPILNEEFHLQSESIQTNMKDTAHSHTVDDPVTLEESSKEENPTPQSQFPIDLNYEPQPNSFEWWWDDSTHSNYYENEDESNQYNTLDELLLNEESYFPSESNNNNLTDSENDQNPSANEKL